MWWFRSSDENGDMVHMSPRVLSLRASARMLSHTFNIVPKDQFSFNVII